MSPSLCEVSSQYHVLRAAGNIKQTYILYLYKYKYKVIGKIKDIINI